MRLEHGVRNCMELRRSLHGRRIRAGLRSGALELLVSGPGVFMSALFLFLCMYMDWSCMTQYSSLAVFHGTEYAHDSVALTRAVGMVQPVSKFSRACVTSGYG